MNIKILVIALGVVVSLPATAAQTSNDELLRSCEKKTLVMNKQGDLVGEKLAGFCAGYLQATFHALVNISSSRCTISEAKEAEHLFSVYQRYMKEKKAPSSDSASSTLLQAYRRAFDCK